MRSPGLVTLLALLVVASTSGCYYGHLAAGQTRLLWGRQPIVQLIEDPATPEPLRQRLDLVRQVRAYARTLGLDVGEQYTSYVPWPGDRLVTTVVATRPGEVEAAGFRFPLIGRVPYKGFFDQAAAEREAEDLRAQGLDVCVVPVAAYSTLGWLADPVTEPMLRSDDLDLVETLLHELVHATAYIPDDAEFNEGVANFIGREAAARYLAEHGVAHDERAAEALARELRERTRDSRQLAEALQQVRAEVEALYSGEPAGPERDAQRRHIEQRGRTTLAQLSLAGYEAPELAERIPLGDACLALRGTYTDDLPRHEAVLADLDGDLTAFIRRLVRAAEREEPRAVFFAPDGAGSTVSNRPTPSLD